ncbi:MBL fold metallo-hydrolase [Nocardioides sp. SYSU D00038]|uniref:MBL fold metallo-hydrolase n=1 Tax=Nocardioides sp. SYSU D00038 TaxID=2812554 RepID=UPI001966D347|nr:MBL fold metallo-hydrolase [Nocardioides sp. SYSU D00038]
MTIHHLDAGTFHPRGSLGGRLAPERLVAHCLLVERPDGLLLVDTGLGRADRADPKGRLGPPFVAMMRPDLAPEQAAAAQVEALGHSVDDVTDIVVTHLDLDHAGGIGDFPRARVHVFGAELDAASKPLRRESQRYVRAQWQDATWERHDEAGDGWFGFDSVTVLGDDVVLVPLIGHTRGHCGVAVRRPEGGWLLHAGDSYFHAGEKETPRTCPSGLRAFQSLVQMDRRARHANQERLRELHAAHADEVTVFCAHDASELDRLR